jgi:hypothetical protein
VLENSSINKNKPPQAVRREIDLAWKRHQPDRNRIPNDVARRVRAFKRALKPSATAISHALDGVAWRDTAIDAVCKHGKGRDRALAKLRRGFPGASVGVRDSRLVIIWLEPSKRVLMSSHDDPGLGQDCILVRLVLADATRRAITLCSQWVFEAPDHALARLVQRDPKADLKLCLVEAMTGFLGADAEVVHAAAEQCRTIYLRAGNGVFAAEAIRAYAGDDVVLYARARTYLAGDTLNADQIPLPPAGKEGRPSVLALMRALACETWRKDDEPGARK